MKLGGGLLLALLLLAGSPAFAQQPLKSSAESYTSTGEIVANLTNPLKVPQVKGTLIWIRDANNAPVCTGGGQGAWASYNGTSWTCAFGGSGTSGSGNAVQLQGVNVSATAPADGNPLVYSLANLAWQPGTFPSNATTIQGRAVAATAPSNTNVLTWVSADNQWEPGSGGGGGGGSGTVNSGLGPAIAQYPAGTTTSTVPATVSGDCTIAQGGAITCTKTSGSAFAPSATTDTTIASNISSGLLPAARLPNPSASTLGGVESQAAISHQFLTALSTSGVLGIAQPSAADISGLVASATSDTTVASNITSGILPAARLPNPTASTLGGVQSKAAVASNWINTISTSGVPGATQPSFADISGTATAAQLNTALAAGVGPIVSSNVTDSAITSGHCIQGGTGGILTDTGASCGGAGGPPTGNAGGDLSSTYPNPTVTSGAHIGAATIPNSALATDPTNASNLASGIVAAARLPNPSASTLGGVESAAPVTHQWINSYSILGVPSLSQPAAGDISGLAASATTDTTVASNIGSGILPNARMPNPGPAALGGIQSIGTTTHFFLTGISTLGVPSSAQPVCADLANAAASCSTDTTIATNISSGLLPAARLPNPSASTLGGVQSKAAVASNWINSISTSGVPTATQPNFTDLAGSATLAQVPARISLLTGMTPGTLTSVSLTQLFQSFLATQNQTVDNITGTAPLRVCSVTPTLSLVDCGVTAGACTSFTNTASVNLSSANTQIPGSVNTATITSGHYYAWLFTAGTCSSINANAVVAIH